MDQCLAYLNEPICEHTWPRTWAVRVTNFFTPCSHCLCSGYLVLQATQPTPAGIPARPLTPVERRGTSKSAAKFASPARSDTRCTAPQRGYASPTGPGQGDSHSANVRRNLNRCWCKCSTWKLRGKHPGVLGCFLTGMEQKYGLYMSLF